MSVGTYLIARELCNSMKENWTQALEARVASFSRRLHSVGVIFLVCMMLLTASDILLRFFFNKPILGSVELTETLMVVLVFFGLPFCASENGNVRVELFVGKLPARFQAFFDCFSYFLGLGLFAFITIEACREFYRVWATGKETELLNIPYYPSYGVLIIGCGMLCIVLACGLLRSLMKVVKQ